MLSGRANALEDHTARRQVGEKAGSDVCLSCYIDFQEGSPSSAQLLHVRSMTRNQSLAGKDDGGIGTTRIHGCVG